MRSLGRDQHGHFAPGNSFNPGGRPALEREVVALARSKGVDCIKTLLTLKDDPKVPPSVRAYAANSVLDRGFGRVRDMVSDASDNAELLDAMQQAMQLRQNIAPLIEHDPTDGKSKP
jgi:hypothetical protein